MEQTINTFTKGLQTDIHPMALGNDVLSDALNATFVTMNGNEIILQNDMGNRRVHSAYLPPGYEPVGIKEYGGIIYIAAYNPITGKSLLGSFPSPLRKFVNGTSIGSSDNNRPTGENGIYSLLYKLSGDLDLHVGDKFVITGSLDTDAEPDDANKYSHINNIDTTKTPYKIISPKNKLYTASIGILNSQNEFVDITKSLIRYGVGDISNLNELQKFNAGTFLLPSEPKPSEITTTSTLSDKQLLIWRNGSNFSNYNTYSYKLVGPMYVKYDINHFLTFNYNIYGLKTSDKEATIWIEGIFIYNCPDGISKGDTDNGDETYENYEIGNITVETENNIQWFGLDTDTDENGRKVIKTSGTVINTDDLTSYNKDTNLYTAKVVKRFDNVTEGLYKLNVLVNNAVSTIDVNLSSDIYIDLDKLNSKEIKLTAWRFINGNNTTTLTYAFEAWAAYGETLPTARFEFTDVAEDTLIYTLKDQPIVNGRNTIVLDWSSCNLEPLKLYKVDIYYDKPETLLNVESQTGVEGQTEGQTGSEPEQNSGAPNHAPANTENGGSDGLVEEGVSDTQGDTQGGTQGNTQGDTPQTSPKYTRWLLTTSLMNDCYSVTSNNFIVDYGNPTQKEGLTENKEEQILTNKLTVNPNLNIKVIDKSEIDYDKNIDKQEYFIKHSNTSLSNFEFEYTHKLALDLFLTYNMDNDTRYPTLLGIHYSVLDATESQALDFSEENSNIKSQVAVYGNVNLNNYSWITGTITSNKAGHIVGEILFRDIFKSNVKSDDTLIKNPFGKVVDWFPKSCCVLDDTNKDIESLPVYGKLDVGRSDHHSSIFIRNCDTPVYHPSDGDSDRNKILIDERKCKRCIYPINDDENANYSEIIGSFSSLFKNSKNVILFCFNNDDSDNLTYYKSQIFNQSNNIDANRYCRVYWRMKDGTWAVLLDICSKLDKTSEKDILEAIFEQIIYGYIQKNTYSHAIYCFANSITCRNAHIYIPDNENCAYNQLYSIAKDLQINLNVQFSIGNNLTVRCMNRDTQTKVIEFTVSESPTSYPINYSINIKSDEDFLEVVNKSISNLSLDSIYIDNGNDKDNNGLKLQLDRIYIDYEFSYGLPILSDLNLRSTDLYGNGEYRTIVVNDSLSGNFNDKYDLDWFSDPETNSNYTALDYSYFNIVNKV